MKKRLIGILLLITMFTMLCPISIYAQDNAFFWDFTKLQADLYNSDEYTKVNDMVSMKTSAEYVLADGVYLTKNNGVRIRITPTVNGTVTVMFGGKAPVMPETEIRTGKEDALENGVPIKAEKGKSYYLQGASKDQTRITEIRFDVTEEDPTPTVEPTPTIEATATPTVEPTPTIEVTATPTVIPTTTPTETLAPTPVVTPNPSTIPVTTNKLNVTEYEAGTYEYANSNVFPQSGTKRTVVSDLDTSKRGTHISFDFTMNTLLKEDSISDTQKAYDTFGLEFTNNATKGGGVLVAGKQVGDNAMTFKWRSGKTAWTLPDKYALEVGKTYTFDFLVNEGTVSAKGETVYSVDLTIYNQNGEMMVRAEGLTCRAANGKAKMIYITASPRVTGEKDSVTIANLHTYLAGPKSSVLVQNELNGSAALDIDTQYMVTPNKFNVTSLTFSQPYAVDEYGNELTYITASLSAKCKNGENLPDKISFENNILTIESGLEKGEYDIVVSVLCLYNGELCATYSYNIKINKEEVSADDILNEFTPEITSNGTTILDGTKVTDNILLQQGNSVVNIEWNSNRSDIISNEGMVTRPLDDTSVTLTANISSVAEPNKTKTYSVTVTVTGVSDILNNALEKAVEGLTSADDETKIMSSQILADLHEDIKLITKYTDDINVVYTWSSDSKYLKIKDDIAEIYPLSEDAYDIVLTVKASYGASYLTREIPVKIHLTKDNAADKYAVRCDSIIEDNFEKVAQYDGKTISKNITVPTEGVFGSKISWTSSMPMYLSNAGKYTAPSGKKTVKMEALVSKGTVTSTERHSYEITLKGKSENSSGGGGSSGGGSIGKVTGSYTAPASNAMSSVTNPYTVYDKPVQGFADISGVEWANEAIVYLTEKKIVSGRSNTIFAPNDNITRAEFIKIVMNAFDLTEENIEDVSFSDVNENDWYYTYVASAYEKGIVSGYSDGSFGVNDNITRQDMAVIIYRALNIAEITLDEVREVPELTDADIIADYAKNAVISLYKARVINGISDTEFAPLSFATRAQAAKMIYEIVK